MACSHTFLWPNWAMTRVCLTLCSAAIAPIDAAEVVLVHFGGTIPSYLLDCVEQIRTWSPTIPITVLLEQRAIRGQPTGLETWQATAVTMETLPTSPTHRSWRLRNRLGQDFWNYATRRFFALSDYMSSTNTHHVIHMEYDNMIYADAEKLIEKLSPLYPEIAAPFDCDDRVIPGFVYVNTPKAAERLADHLLKVVRRV